MSSTKIKLSGRECIVKSEELSEMAWNSQTHGFRVLVFTAASAIAASAPAHALSFADLYKAGFDQFNKTIYKAVGTLRICAANEVKPWLSNDVVPTFRQSEKGVVIGESDLVFNGSGELADNWNDANKDKCDIIILGSDVSALRAADFDRTKAVSIAYTPTVFVGLKNKFAAAREFLKKGATDPLSCSDLAQAAKKGRMSRLKPGGIGKLTLEMSTSNSGQTGYVSCVYSELNAESAKEVEAALDGSAGEAKQAALRDFMGTVIFEQQSSSKVKDLFIQGEGMGVGAAHLAIATYESYLPEITKAAAANGIELETIYPAVSILSNFPAFVIAKQGTPAYDASKAFLQMATSAKIQQQLVKYGMRPALQGVQLAPYMNMKIEVGDSPRNRKDLRKLWDVVGKVDAIRAAGVLDFPQ
jgi:ABC-type Fe3+ transport system substrate-binding protein